LFNSGCPQIAFIIFLTKAVFSHTVLFRLNIAPKKRNIQVSCADSNAKVGR